MNQETINSLKVYTEAKSLLGTVVAPLNAEDGYGMFGCAITVNTIFKKALGAPIGGGYSTHDMFDFLKDTQTFDSVLLEDALPGDVIISPTGYSVDPSRHGHVGIVGKFGILSNNSETGHLEENYTLSQWKQIYGVTLGFPVCVFRIK